MIVNKNLIPYFMILAISVTLVASDLYLPAMPLMVEYFNTNDGEIQNSISAFQIGFIFSAITFGPLSDSFGRRNTLIAGFGIFMLGSIILIFSTDIDFLLAMRVVQGFGAGVSAALGPAVLRDVFTEKESSKVIAQMSMIILLTPALAPVLGGYLTTYFGWQACFIFVALTVTAALAIFYRYFPETHPVETRTQLRVSNLLRNYKIVLSNKSFLFYVLLHSLPASALWCYITVMPFVFIKYMGVETHIFGYYILLQALAAAATSFYVQRVVTKHSSSKIMLNGLRLLFVGCVAMFIAALWVPKDPLIATFCVIPFLMGIPFIFPSSMAKAMSFVSHSKGTAASCIATARQFFALVGSLVAAALPDDTLFPTALYMLIVASCASACYYLAHKHDLAGEVIS